MQVTCVCGKQLSDISDAQFFKAWLIADEDWTAFNRSFESERGSDWNMTTQVYQCPDCGRIRFEKPPGNVVYFKPEDESVSRRLLGSVRKLSEKANG
jgi:hypothetical protein